MDAVRADIIDFLVKLLKEHERNLSRQIDRLEASMKLLESNAKDAQEKPTKNSVSKTPTRRRKGFKIGDRDGKAGCKGKREGRRKKEGKT